MPKKCDQCNKDALVVEQDVFYSCADCWIKDNAHKVFMYRKGKKDEKSSRVS